MRKVTRAARISVAVAAALAAGVALAGAAGAEETVSGGAAGSGTTASTVAWGPCDGDVAAQIPEGQQDRYRCATRRVPIDHANAALGTIDIALMKRSANKPKQKLGSVFLNPGGPGGSGLAMPLGAGDFLEPAVLDRFDVVGFDPRGVGESNALRCFTTAEDSADVQSRMVAVPQTRQEISDTLGAYRDYGDFCDRNGGTLLDHMSTEDVARDLDDLREAVGDDKLNYVGFSYGTLLGATYSNLFPGTVRTMVLDGNVDPELRTNDGQAYDLQRATGFQSSFDAFLARCEEAGTACGFGQGDPTAKFDELLSSLRDGPVTLSDGSEVDLGDVVGGIGSALYSPDALPGLADDLQQFYTALESADDGAVKDLGADELGTLLNPAQNPRHDVRPDSPYETDDSFFGVNCADKSFDHSADDVPSIAARWDEAAPVFGRSQAYADLAACPLWKGAKDAYRGPWNASTQNPVLVVGNYHDPATRYDFAKRMADELGYARLLPVDAFGHCILGQADGVDRAVSDYLVDLKVPQRGKVYQPNAQPFDS